MLKLILAGVTFLLTLGTFSANAQMADRLSEHPGGLAKASAKAPTVDAQVMTREMTERLHLNEGQFLKLLPVNRTKLAGVNSINRQYKNDEAQRAQKMAELEAQYEQECSRILTPSQLSQLQQEHGQPSTVPPATGNGLG